MASGGIPPNGAVPDLGSRNVAMDTENASKVYLYDTNLEKADDGLHVIRNPENQLQDSHNILDSRNVFCQGFSIREYVGKVRSVNIRKCWPLSESLLEEKLKEGREPSLPPLKSPNFRWWACQHSLHNDAEHKHIGSIGTALDRQPILYSMEENDTNDTEENIENQLTVSLGTSQVDPGISQDIEEQIQKLSSVQISGEDEDVDKIHEEKRRIHSTEEGAEDNRQRYLPPEKQILKCSMLKALENPNPRGKSVEQNHLPVRVVSDELKGCKTVHPTSETTKLESIKYGISDMGKGEGSVLKICPVCKIFSSTTVTTVNAHMDDCLAQPCKQEKGQCKTQKKKSRASKKRSIIDIFAAAPQVQISLNNVQNNERNESGGSEGMDICSDDATANLTPKENSTPIETGSATAFCDELPILIWKQKKPANGRSHVESENADNGRVESLQMKRKRQRSGMISRLSTPNGIKEPQTHPGFTDVMDDDYTIANHLKRSKILKEVLDEQKPSMQMTCKQRPLAENKQDGLSGTFKDHCHSPRRLFMKALAENKEDGLSGTFKDYSHSPRMLSIEHKAKRGSISNDTALAQENGRIIREDSIEEPSSIVNMANVTSMVSNLYGMQDSAIHDSESDQPQNKFNILDNNLCKLDKEDSPNSSTLQVEGRPQQNKLDLLKFSKENSTCKEDASPIPDTIVDNEPFKGTDLKSKCSVMHFLEETQSSMIADNSEQEMKQLKSKAKGNKDTQSFASQSERVQGFDGTNEKWNGVCLTKERHCFETRKGTKGQYIRHTGLNLNQKVCVLPRDSKGRFVSSTRKNEEKAGNTPCPPWKQSHRHKTTKAPKSWSNTTAVHSETNFSINAAFSNARFGKATSLQTFIPVYKDLHSPKEPELTQEVASLYDCVETLSNGRRFLLPTAALRHVEAHSCLNTMNLVNFCTLRKCSDDGYIGLPLDSHGELVKHVPSTRPVVTQVFRTPDYMTVDNPLVSKSTKMPQEFSFLESTSVNGPFQAIGERKETHHWQEYLISNQPKQDRMCCEQSFLSDQIQRDKTYCGSSHTDIAGSSNWKADSLSNARPCIKTSFESGYDADQRRKALQSEKIYPEVQNTRREQPTTQPVIRLMGKSFTISGEREAGNALGDGQQGNRNDSQTTTGASSAYMDYCRTCNKRQFDLSDYGLNDFCQHQGGKANATRDYSGNFKDISSAETDHSQGTVMEEVTTCNKDGHMMVDNRLTDCTHYGQSLKGQCSSSQSGMSRKPFCAQKLISPVFYSSTNNGLNGGPNLRYKDTHISDQGWLTHNQSYSELNSYLTQESFQKTDWTCTGTLDSPPIQPHLHPSLQYPSSLRPFSNLLHGATSALTHSASIPAKKRFNCQTTSSTYAPERAYGALKLPNNKNRNKFKSTHEKGKIIDIVNLESECRDDLRTRESIQEINGLHRKCILEKHEDCAAGQNQKCDVFSIPNEQHKGSSLQFAESKKLSGGAKHILKPAFQTGNGQQSLTRHYTLPFAEDTRSMHM